MPFGFVGSPPTEKNQSKQLHIVSQSSPFSTRGFFVPDAFS
jgi:hypothetical protein